MHAEFCQQLFSPRSMAIIGASERNFYSRNAFERLHDCGFAGRVHLVNPNSRSVFGRTCFENLADIGEQIDMAFIAVPRDGVLGALRDCAASGTKAAVVISNGFGESPDERGRALQHELAQFLGEHAIALCGPACLGVINVHERFEAFGGHRGTEILPGSIALVSQSGANVHSYVGAALARNLGFSYLASSGNEMGLDVPDYIDYFLRDENTRVICAYVETFRSADKLVQVARQALDAGKPIIAIKIGRSESSARAALAHTGAMTGPDLFFDTLFKQYGILRANTIEEALDRVVIFAASPRRWWPTGKRAGVVSISGGFAATFSDLSNLYGFEVPALESSTTERLASILPANVNPQNPIDISTQVQRDRPDAWTLTLGCMADDAHTDYVLDAEALPQSEQRIRILLSLRDQSQKPVLLASTSPHITIVNDELKALCRVHGLPIMAGVEGTQRAIQSALWFRSACDRWESTESERKLASKVAPIPRPPKTVLHEVDARALLSSYGIRGPLDELVLTPGTATKAAARLGGPVAIKIVSSHITHRSDRGLVQLNVLQKDVLQTAAMLLSRIGEGEPPADTRILVQEMITGTAELFIGITRSAGYLPMIVVGVGGVLVELLGDRSCRLCPVDVAEAHSMLRELRLYPSLCGYRGRPRADVDAAARTIAAMSEFAMAASDWISEAEINPLIVLSNGNGASAVDALIVATE